MHKHLEQASGSCSLVMISSLYCVVNSMQLFKVISMFLTGLDLDCGIYYTNFTQKSVEQGKAREEHIDRSLTYLYVVLMRLGFFDGIPQFQSLGKKDICSKQHIELAAQAAREGIVLLKNDNDTLPLRSDKIKTIAVVGPHANATSAMLGNYAGSYKILIQLYCKKSF